MGGQTSQLSKISVSVDGVAYTDIECVTSIGVEDAETPEIDVSCLSSTSKEYILGLPDAGTVSLELNVNFQDAGYLLLKAARDSGSAYKFQIEWSDSINTTGTIFSFDGFVKSLPISGSVDEAITGSCNIRITGDVVETPPIP